ncbi:hypothetical protein ACPXBB_26350, partial [Escherichia coli]|uniref:hypothetical protein n=1 Tax=Escherichia coli TaxID=562 RepID=UPI003CF1B9A1
SFQRALRDLSANAPVKVSVHAAPPQPQAVVLPQPMAPLPNPAAMAVPGAPMPVGIVYAGLVMPPAGYVSSMPGLALI